MANSESPTPNIVFRGTGGNECEAFVVAIREMAFEKGKDDDHWWMCRYATTRLRGNALRWHAKLDPSVQTNWFLFIQALFEEYPPEEERNEIATPVWTSTTLSPTTSTVIFPGPVIDPLHTPARIPQPAERETVSLGAVQSSGSLASDGTLAPLARVYDPSLSGFQIGRLRVEYEEGGLSPQYVHRGQSNTSGSLDIKGVTNLTMNIQEALCVIFLSSSEPHQIRCMNSGQPGTWNLGIQLLTAETSEFHPVVGSWRAAFPCSREVYYTNSDLDYQIVSSIWNVLTDGTLRATLAGESPA